MPPKKLIKPPSPTLTNDASGLATFYNLMFSPQGFVLPPHLLDVVRALMDERIRKLMVIIGPGSGKAVHPDTPVLTPAGWVPIRNLKVDDYVVTPDGVTHAKVRGVFWQPKSKLYKLTFADGRTILANKDHLWKVYNKKFLLGNVGLKWRLRTTEELCGYVNARGDHQTLMQYIPLTKPVENPKIDLPIDPYVLGCALGDGHLSAVGFLTMSCADEEIIDKIAQSPGVDSVGKNAGKYSWGIRGLGKQFVRLGLRDCRSWDKFIPEIYKRASVEQRLELLRGLMDTDGTVGKLKTVSYCTTSKQLAIDVQELVWSLGGMCYMAEKSTSFTHKGEKKSGRLAYNLSIRHPNPESLFYLARKRERAQPTQYSDDLKLEILSIEQVEESESVCINIDHPDGLFLVDNYIVTHNSLLLSVVYPAFTIGMDPTMTVLGISAGEALMQGFQRTVMDWIDTDPVYRMTFPTVMPDKKTGWSTERGAFVTGHEYGNPDANYFTAGLTSSALTGKHARIVLGDDLHNKETASTGEQCLKVRGDYYRTIIGRADPRGARFIFAGRRWNQDDVYGHLMDPKGDGTFETDWVTMVLPAIREDGNNSLYWDIAIPEFDADGNRFTCCFNDGTLDNLRAA